MEVQTGSVSFNRSHGYGPRTEQGEVVFSAPVSQAAAFLSGFDVAFSPRNDHHLGQLEVVVEATIDRLAPQRVNVDVTYGLRDWSNEWDDYYEGEVRFVVVAD